MPTSTSAIPGVEISHRRTFPDERGNFLELMRRSEHDLEFVQANHSFSRAGVVRGLHYHRHQHDLWYVVRGRDGPRHLKVRTRTRLGADVVRLTRPPLAQH